MTKPVVAVALRSMVIVIIISSMVVAQFSAYWRGLDAPWLLRAGALIVRGDSLRNQG
jgi:hypothetical protein